MFKDYYAILEMCENATQEEIKSAFKRQALKWHPDKNPGRDTTHIMQEINEAYLILKDTEAREHYNREYLRFKQFKEQKEQQKKKQEQAYQHEESRKRQREYHQAYEEKKSQQTEHADFKVEDDLLKKWMENAKRQAVDLAKQSIEDLKGMIIVGTKAAVIEGGSYLIFQLALSAIVLIIFLIVKSCRN